MTEVPWNGQPECCIHEPAAGLDRGWITSRSWSNVYSVMRKNLGSACFAHFACLRLTRALRILASSLGNLSGRIEPYKLSRNASCE